MPQTDRLNGFVSSDALKVMCKAIAITPLVFINGAPFGYQNIDGIDVTDNVGQPTVGPDRVFLPNQADLTQNGIWLVSSVAWQRAPDFDDVRDAINGTLVQGYLVDQSVSTYRLTSDNPIIFGTTELEFDLVATVSKGQGGVSIFKSMPVSGSLSKGDMVNVFNSGGTAFMRQADATDATKPMHGFVLVDLNDGDTGTFYAGGRIDNKFGHTLTPGAEYWLATTPGRITTTPPSASGNLVQKIGIALSSTVLFILNLPGTQL